MVKKKNRMESIVLVKMLKYIMHLSSDDNEEPIMKSHSKLRIMMEVITFLSHLIVVVVTSVITQ